MKEIVVNVMPKLKKEWLLKKIVINVMPKEILDFYRILVGTAEKTAVDSFVLVASPYPARSLCLDRI